MSNNDPTALQLLNEDLKTYRQHETWAVGLVLGGIALLTKQLAEWNNCAIVSLLSCFSPSLVGVAALVHLRVLNFRGWEVRRKIQRTEASEKLGCYGTLMAFWPVAFGYLSSCFLLGRHSDRCSCKPLLSFIYSSIIMGSIILLIFILTQYFSLRARRRWIENNE